MLSEDGGRETLSMITHIFGAIGHDIRVAARTLVRAPTFFLVAIATLAIGIGCTTAAFSVLDTAVWRGLPYDRSELLQTVFERSDDGALRVPSYPTFRDWQAQTASV